MRALICENLSSVKIFSDSEIFSHMCHDMRALTLGSFPIDMCVCARAYEYTMCVYTHNHERCGSLDGTHSI